MIISEHMSSAFIEWDDQSSKFEYQTALVWGDLAIPVGLVVDKETGEKIDSAYFLFYDYRIRVFGDKRQDILLTALHKTQYMINFEKDKSEINDFIELLKDSSKRMRIAYKNRIKVSHHKKADLPEISEQDAMKAIVNLFEVTLPKYNLR